MKKKLVILGAGGNSIDILGIVQDIADRQGQAQYECIGFLDDNRDFWGKEHCGVKVLGPLSMAADCEECCFVNGIGSPASFWKKKDILSRLRVPLERFVTLVHPTASVSRTVRIGLGTVVFPNVTISSCVTIGNHVIIFPNSIISHEVFIGDYSCVAGGVCLSGGVAVGESCYLGTNSSIKGRLTIGDLSLVGMGSVVLRGIEENSVVVGNPARFLRRTIRMDM